MDTDSPRTTDSTASPPNGECGAIHPQTDVMRKTGLVIKPCARPAGHQGHGGKPQNSIGQAGHIYHVEQIDEASQ